MAHNYTVARPYARAIFMEAKAKGQFSEWQQSLEILRAVVWNYDVRRALSNPKISRDRWTTLLLEFVTDQVKNISASFKQELENFLHLLSERKRLQLIPDIQTLFHALVLQNQGILNVEVFSAFPLEDAQKEKLLKELERKFNSKVQADYRSDESLIGGALVRAGNWVLDGSIRGKLERLAEGLR